MDKDNKIPEWDILTTTGGFNMKTFYALGIILTAYILNTIITIVTVVNNNNKTLESISLFFISSTLLSYVLTITAIVLAHKGLKECRANREKGQGFAQGVLIAGYFSALTIGLVFLIMDIMYIMLLSK